ncbi:beta-lactamase/transpeptidase-like protein [Exidia glandulosa HHB12029]|uniref:Beta-lactamase/transpeptidase-like protein n=1 Tax=Exidia glandulosa HHB12029 TaxID=1314781 RepID=A0A165EQB8_EXIGL|nr:beta-lactamase/transpeptidase-like protein [Exidia glandulosa HHB12029]
MSLQAQIIKTLDDGVARGAVAGAVFGVIDRDGRVLVEEAVGVRALGLEQKMTKDTIFPIFSCAKLITAIAAMQLVERGQLRLDEPLETVLPELAHVRILQDDLTFKPAVTKITLRMLLSHTAGFSYSSNPKLAKYLDVSPLAVPELSGKRKDVLETPLVYEPGTSWEYSVAMDWAGEAIMRVTGLTLEQYCEQNIFQPLGIRDTSFSLTPQQRENLVGIQIRKDDGTLAPGDFSPFPFVDNPEYQSGGAGAFGTLSSFLKILTTMINGGIGPNGARILEESTVKTMWLDQAETFPLAKEAIRNEDIDINSFYTGVKGTGRGWGLSFQLNLTQLPTGRSAGSGTWIGVANLYYAIDPVKGLATALFAQSSPIFDTAVCRLFAELETAVYDDFTEA